MSKVIGRAGVIAAVLVVAAAGLGAQQDTSDASGLSAEDIQQIRQLSARYAQTLGACAAEAYADLFTPDGVFASGFRGRVEGRERLIELVRSERHCRAENRVPADGNRPLPALTIEPSAGGATAKAALPNNGGLYEDTYVRTAGGWRFKVREYLTPEEAASRVAKPPALTALDYIEIEQLVNRYAFAIDTCSNNGYDYADLYTPDGIFYYGIGGRTAVGREQLAEAAGGGKLGCKRHKSATADNPVQTHVTVNLVIEPAAEGAIGKSYLVYPGVRGISADPDHSGHVGGYQDVYVKTAQGWRIKKRIHVFPPEVPGTFQFP